MSYNIVTLTGTGNKGVDMTSMAASLGTSFNITLKTNSNGEFWLSSTFGNVSPWPLSYGYGSGSITPQAGYWYKKFPLPSSQYVYVSANEKVSSLSFKNFMLSTVDSTDQLTLAQLKTASLSGTISAEYTIAGTNFADKLLALGGTQITFQPGGGADTVVGSGNADTFLLNSDEAVDSVQGGGGDDVFIISDPLDFVDGGEGADVVRTGNIGTATTEAQFKSLEVLEGAAYEDETGWFAVIYGGAAQFSHFSTIRLSPEANGAINRRLYVQSSGLGELNLSAAKVGALNLVVDDQGEGPFSVAGPGTNITTGSGNDTITSWGGSDTIRSGKGDDHISAFGDKVTVDGGAGKDMFSMFDANGYGSKDYMVDWTISNVEVLQTSDKRIWATEKQFNVFSTIERGNGQTGKVMLQVSKDQNTIDFYDKIVSGGLDLVAGSGVEKITLTKGNDVFKAGRGNDTVVLRTGKIDDLSNPGSTFKVDADNVEFDQFKFTYRGNTADRGTKVDIKGPATEGLDRLEDVEFVEIGGKILPLAKIDIDIVQKTQSSGTLSWSLNGEKQGNQKVYFDPTLLTPAGDYTAVYRTNGGSQNTDKRIEFSNYSGKSLLEHAYVVQIHGGNKSSDSASCIVGTKLDNSALAMLLSKLGAITTGIGMNQAKGVAGKSVVGTDSHYITSDSGTGTFNPALDNSGVLSRASYVDIFRLPLPIEVHIAGNLRQAELNLTASAVAADQSTVKVGIEGMSVALDRAVRVHLMVEHAKTLKLSYADAGGKLSVESDWVMGAAGSDTKEYDHLTLDIPNNDGDKAEDFIISRLSGSGTVKVKIIGYNTAPNGNWGTPAGQQMIDPEHDDAAISFPKTATPPAPETQLAFDDAATHQSGSGWLDLIV